MPGGGVPWFMTVFGRDSLIAAYQSVPFHRSSRGRRSRRSPRCRRRSGTTGATRSRERSSTSCGAGRSPRSGRSRTRPTTASHDATMLFLILLDEYERWSGDTELVRELEPNARAALAWLEGPADLDGDGTSSTASARAPRARSRTSAGRTRDDSILFADGSLAEPPIAICEHQGYAYDARLRTARLAREVWDDEETAARLERRRGGAQGALQPRLLDRRRAATTCSRSTATSGRSTR